MFRISGLAPAIRKLKPRCDRGACFIRLGACCSHDQELNQKNMAHAIQLAPKTTAIQGSYLLPPWPGDCRRLSSFQIFLSSRFMPATTSLLKAMNATPASKKAIAAIFECIRIRANVPAHRRRANRVRFSTDTRSRRSVQPICSTMAAYLFAYF